MEEQQKRKGALYQVVLLFLSIYVLTILVIESFFIDNPETKQVLQTIDLIICAIFLLDFAVNLIIAKSKVAYLKWGWIDLISSIPAIDPLRWGRLSRVIRIIRFLRSIKSIKILLQNLQRSKIQSLTVVTALFIFIGFTLSSALILEFERAHNMNLDTASEAIEWATLNLLNAKVSINQAMTKGGIFLTVFLNKSGLLLFAYFNAIIIAWLVSKKRTGNTPLVDMS